MLSRWKNVSSLEFQQLEHFRYYNRCVYRAFIEKVNSRCFCRFPTAILVDQNCPPIWRLHTKLYKAAWKVLANNSETVSHKDLRLGQIVYILVFYNISFSWLRPLDGFWFLFLSCLLCDMKMKNLTGCIFVVVVVKMFTHEPTTQFYQLWHCQFSA